ncbi:hypothetical protein [Scytonema sp. PRP1]|uniref:hypothetical protein n=1 Tax=Scytonema sp. PRP1 TaxID=3120513 RepID=UPI00300D6A29
MMKEPIPQTTVETFRPNGWILGFDAQSSNLQFGLPLLCSPVLATQPVYLCSGRIKFLDTNYKPKLPARQSHCLIYWGDNVQLFREVFEPYGVIHLPAQPLYKEEAQQRTDDEWRVSEFLLGDIENRPSKDSEQIEIPPSKDSPSTNSSKSHISPSNSSPSKKHRNWGEGNGTIYWRTITKNGKEYPQAYYHWKENGLKRTKYIPKQLLGVIQEAEEQKRPVIEILGLLGVVQSPSKNILLGDIINSPSNNEITTSKKSPSTQEEPSCVSLKDSPSNDGGQVEATTSKDSPSKTRRDKGLGSGSIQWKTITLHGKDYPQAWYHYEFWKDGDRLVKKSRYIPKRLLKRVQELEIQKAPVKEVLVILGVKL